MTLRAISYGGGVQSTALVVLAASGRIPPVDAAVFANVGDDSEKATTLRYIREEVMPWAAERGVKVVEVSRPGLTLLQKAYEDAARGLTPLPMKLTIDGVKHGLANRTCTIQWKAVVVARWLRANGASPKAPAELLIGFSTDEYQRATTGRDRLYERRSFPLLELNLSRDDCMSIIGEAGLPVPPKSACWFCPFHRAAEWSRMRRDDPATFAAVQHLEDAINAGRATSGRPDMWFTDKPLASVREAEPSLFDTDESCDEGYCFT